MSYFVYILTCVDNTLYIGSTHDLEKRLHAHNHLKSGAHYTKIRRPVKLVYSEKCKTYAQVRAREGELKSFSRKEKLSLIKSNTIGLNFDDLFKRFKIKVVRRKIKRPKRSRKEYLEYKNQALHLVKERLEHWNKHYKFEYKKVVIRNQKTRWGSCSKTGNLSFNYKIAKIPLHLADYIVVHELCHIGQFNHSQKFWDLVGETMPDYKKMRQELKKMRV
jgi:predicted metal-dependent hydrolase